MERETGAAGHGNAKRKNCFGRPELIGRLKTSEAPLVVTPAEIGCQETGGLRSKAVSRQKLEAVAGQLTSRTLLLRWMVRVGGGSPVEITEREPSTTSLFVQSSPEASSGRVILEKEPPKLLALNNGKRSPAASAVGPRLLTLREPPKVSGAVIWI